MHWGKSLHACWALLISWVGHGTGALQVHESLCSLVGLAYVGQKIVVRQCILLSPPCLGLVLHGQTAALACIVTWYVPIV